MAAEAWMLATQFAAAAAMLGVALWLVVLAPTRVPNRVFGCFLLLSAANIVVIWSQPLVDPRTAAILDHVNTYYSLALPFVIAWFLLEYPRRVRYARSAKVALLAGALLVETLYAFDRCAVRCIAPDGSQDLSYLGLLLPARPVSAALAAFILAAASKRMSAESPAAATRLVALGFAVDALVLSGVFVARSIRLREEWLVGLSGDLAMVAGVIPLLAFPVAIAASWRLLDGRIRKELLVLPLGAGITGLYVGAVPGDMQAFLIGLWRLTLPALVAYALLRERLFDLDVRLTHGFARTLSGGLVIATFFVASEGAAAFLSARVGTYFGILAAGLVVFAIAPLQARIDDAFARRLPPSRRLAKLDLDARVVLYRHQVELACMDGRIDPGERAMLEELRVSLAIPEPVAAAVDRTVGEGSMTALKM